MQPYSSSNLTAIPDPRPLHRAAFAMCRSLDHLTVMAPRRLFRLVVTAIVLALLGYFAGELVRWAFGFTGSPGHRIPAREMKAYPEIFAFGAASLAMPVRLLFSAISYAGRRAPIALFFTSLIPGPVLLLGAIVGFALSIVCGFVLTPLWLAVLTIATFVRFVLPRSYRRLSSM